MVKRRAIAKAPVIRPITIGGFVLTTTGMDVRGRPSFEEYEAAGEFIKRAHNASGFWLGDWLRYGEKRADWQTRISQVQDATGLSEKTIRNVRAIAGIDASRRRDDVDFSLHSEVAAMSPEDQSAWLERAHDEGWGVRELRLEIRASKRRAVIDGQAMLEGMYRVIYADPPWIYGDRPPSGSGAQQHYPGMTVDELCKLPVAAHTLPDAVLFLWTTAPLALANPGVREVGEAWGFTYKQQWIWDKVERNFGHYSNGNHEILTIWTRGTCLPDVPTDLPDSIQTIRKSNVHSAKPEEFRALIKRHWTQGPNLELFARERVADWDVLGNDARLWGAEAEAQAQGVTV